MEQAELGFKVKKTSAKITPHGGLVLVDRMAHALGVPTSIEQGLGHLKIRNRGHKISDKVMDVVRMLVAGGSAISDLGKLRNDKVLKDALGRDSLMACSTASEFLAQLAPLDIKDLSCIEGRAACDTLHLSCRKTATLDADATFIESHKREAVMSYHKEPGYYPMLGFVAETQGLLLSEFRDGNASPASGALPFLKEMVRRLPPTVKRIRVRSDSAWFNHRVMDWSDDRGIEFAITAEKNEHMADVIEAIPEEVWEVFGDDPDEQIGESVYSFEHGKRAYRIIVLRTPRRQTNMFEGRYCYHAIITNMDWERRNLVKWHRERATSENWIKELKSGFGLDHLPSGKFLSNAAFLHIVGLAYNLTCALKVLSLPEEYRSSTIKTLRYRLINIAAIWVRHARQYMLKFSASAKLVHLIQSILHQPFKLCRA